MNSTFSRAYTVQRGGERVPQHELLACAQCGCFAFSCFEDFAIRVNSVGGHGISGPSVVRDLSRDVRANAGLAAVSENDFVDRFGGDTAFFQSTFGRGDTEVTGL